jgi:hypothetical protein
MKNDPWEIDGKLHGWSMPPSPWWKRLPIIRHVRAMYNSYLVNRHNTFYRGIGLIPTGYDTWVLHGIWRGK